MAGDFSGHIESKWPYFVRYCFAVELFGGFCHFIHITLWNIQVTVAKLDFLLDLITYFFLFEDTY